VCKSWGRSAACTAEAAAAALAAAPAAAVLAVLLQCLKQQCSKLCSLHESRGIGADVLCLYSLRFICFARFSVWCSGATSTELAAEFTGSTLLQLIGGAAPAAVAAPANGLAVMAMSECLHHKAANAYVPLCLCHVLQNTCMQSAHDVRRTLLS
jgi:hypothetical protein